MVIKLKEIKKLREGAFDREDDILSDLGFTQDSFHTGPGAGLGSWTRYDSDDYYETIEAPSRDWKYVSFKYDYSPKFFDTFDELVEFLKSETESTKLPSKSKNI